MKAITFAAIVSIAWCAGAASAADSLYERLGGEAGVRQIADALIDRVSVDPVTAPSFKDAKLDRIKRLLAEQLCELGGGPCRYSGDSMRDVHAGLDVSEAQFYRMVDDLRAILRERRVPLSATNQLLRLLAPMKRDVVEHGRPAAAAAGAPGAGRAERP